MALRLAKKKGKSLAYRRNFLHHPDSSSLFFNILWRTQNCNNPTKFPGVCVCTTLVVIHGESWRGVVVWSRPIPCAEYRPFVEHLSGVCVQSEPRESGLSTTEVVP